MRCDCLSYVPDTVTSAIFCLVLLLVILTVVIAFEVHSWEFAAIGLIASVGCYCGFWHIVKLRPTTSEQVAVAKKLSFWGFVFAAIATVFN